MGKYETPKIDISEKLRIQETNAIAKLNNLIYYFGLQSREELSVTPHKYSTVVLKN